jgi:hypothetical protein
VTADWYLFERALLAHPIITEVKSINGVLFDVTSTPRSSNWE